MEDSDLSFMAIVSLSSKGYTWKLFPQFVSAPYLAQFCPNALMSGGSRYCSWASHPWSSSLGSAVWSGQSPPILPRANCVTLGRLPSFSVLHVPHHWKGNSVMTQGCCEGCLRKVLKHWEKHLTCVFWISSLGIRYLVFTTYVTKYP